MSLHDIPNQMLKNISHPKQEIEGYDNYRLKQQSISESLKFLEQSPINSEREIEVSLKSLISRATVEELLRIKFFIKKRDYLLKVQQSLTTNVFSQISTNKHSIIESFIENIDASKFKKLGEIKCRKFFAISTWICLEKDIINELSNSTIEILSAPAQLVNSINTELDNPKKIKNINDYKDAIKNNLTIYKKEYKTQLDETISTIVIEYEKNGKNVFDDFEDIYTFVQKWIGNSLFSKINVGRAHHEIQGINKRKSTRDTIINNKEMFEYKNQKTHATLNVPKALGGKFYPATLRTFMVLTKVHTESNSHIPSLSFTVSDYMNICGLRDKKSAVEQLKRDLEIITTSILKYNRGTVIDGQMNIINKWELNKKTRRLEISFTPAYFDEIKYYPTGYISDSVLKLDIHKHPNSLHFEFKANQHKRSNYGKKNENIISVETLLNGANIPIYEEIKNQSESFYRKIVEPFERDMHALDPIFIWEYCGDRGIPLTDEAIQEFTHDQFVKFNVKITWKQYPDQVKRIEKKKNYIYQSKTKKIKSKKPK